MSQRPLISIGLPSMKYWVFLSRYCWRYPIILSDSAIFLDLVEGFIFINVPTNYNISNPNTVIQNPDNTLNLLEVQTFYTANALETLPHEVIYENISFYILNDETGKIPTEQIRTTMDVTIQSKLDEISNTETKIKQILAGYYNIENDDLDKISVRIKNISIGVSTLIDDHAISLHVVSPQTTNNEGN